MELGGIRGRWLFIMKKDHPVSENEPYYSITQQASLPPLLEGGEMIVLQFYLFGYCSS